MYDRLIDYFTINSFNVKLKQLECFNLVNLGKVGQNQRFSIGLTIAPPGISEDQYIKIFSDNVLSQLSQNISKDILRYIVQNGEVHYVDLAFFNKKYINSHDEKTSLVRNIVVEISSIGSVNIVSNARLVSEIQDSYSFNFNHKNVLTSAATIYNVGRLHAGKIIEVYVDPIMNWNDNFIMLFDSINLDISNFTLQVVDDSTFNPRLEVSYGLSFDVVNPKVLYVFDNDHRENYEKCKPVIRDRKIDQILGKS